MRARAYIMNVFPISSGLHINPGWDYWCRLQIISDLQTTTLELIVDVNGWMADPLYDLSEPWADQSICPMGGVCTLGFPTMSGPQPQQMMQENAGNVFSMGSVSQN